MVFIRNIILIIIFLFFSLSRQAWSSNDATETFEKKQKDDTKTAFRKSCSALGPNYTMFQEADEHKQGARLLCLKNGIVNGPFASFYKSGNKRVQGFFQNGKNSGHWIRWYENGKKKDEGNFTQGKPNGVWFSWYPTGDPKSIGWMFEGEPVCKWKTWDLKKTSSVKLEKNLPSAECNWTNKKVESFTDSGPRNTKEIARTYFVPHFLWFLFHISTFDIFQKSGGSTYSGEIGWNPAFRITEHWSVQANIEGTGIKNASGITPVFGYELLATLEFSPIRFDLGGGAQTWVGQNGGTAPVFSSNLSFYLGWSFLDRVILGYSLFLFPQSDLTHEIKLGIGIAL